MARLPTDCEKLLRRFEAVKSDSSSWRTLCERIAELFRPSEIGFVSKTTPGNDRTAMLYDGEQVTLANQLAVSIESMLMPRDEQWVEVTTSIPAELQSDEEKKWLDKAGTVMVDQMYDPDSGLEAMTSRMFPDLITFGAAAGYVGERRDLKGLLYKPISLSRFWWLRDEAGNADTAFLTEELTVRQAAQRYGKEKLSDKSQRLLDQKPDEKIEILQIVQPRDDYTPGSRLARDMLWSSTTIEMQAKHVLRESGFQEFPFLVPEWQVLDNGDIWSPARQALPDARQLQAMGQTILSAGQKSVNPPILVPNDSILGPLKLIAGGVSIYDSSKDPTGRGEIVKRIDIGGNMPLGLEMQQDVRRKLGEIFLKQVLQLPDQHGMTATEVMRRGNDLLRLTSSPFGRIETGMNRPMVGRTFALLMRKSVLHKFGEGSPFEQPPASLDKRHAEFKFLSPIARARRTADVAAFSQIMEALLPVIQMKPDLLYNIDLKGFVRDTITTVLSPKYVVDEKVVEQQEQADEAAKQAAQVTAAAPAVTGAMANVQRTMAAAQQMQQAA